MNFIRPYTTPRKVTPIWVVLTAAFLCTSGILSARDSIWSAVVEAENSSSPVVPEKIAEFMPAIKEVFGYNSAKLIGLKKQPILPGKTEWLLPTKEHFFQIVCKNRDESSYTVYLEVYSGKQLLFTAEARLGREEPLLIRGPQEGSTQTILILWVR